MLKFCILIYEQRIIQTSKRMSFDATETVQETIIGTKQMKKNLSEEARKKETEVSLLAKGPTSNLLVETTKNKSIEELETRN